MEQIKKLLTEKDRETPENTACLSIVVKLRESELPMEIYGFTWTSVGGPVKTRLTEAIKDAEEKLNSVYHFYPDWSMSTDQKTCPLTLDEYEEPYFLNMNGRTYSKKAIIEAVQSTLLKGENLRLEDITIYPDEDTAHNFKLYAHRTLNPNAKYLNGEPHGIVIDVEAMTYKGYRETPANRNIPEFSKWLGNINSDSNGMWDDDNLYAKYARKRGLPEKPADGRRRVEDIKIEDIMMFRHHPKCDEGIFVFSNCKFTRCMLKLYCWCGVTFINCLFEQCIITDKLERDVSARGCLFKNCITEGSMATRLRGFMGARFE